MDGRADLDREGPERLHRLALHLILEALEAVGPVSQFEEGNVGAVVTERLARGVALHRNDGARHGLHGDLVVLHFLIQDGRQIDKGAVPGRTDRRGSPSDIRLRHGRGRQAGREHDRQRGNRTIELMHMWFPPKECI